MEAEEATELYTASSEVDDLFGSYGEFVLLLDADLACLTEAMKSCSVEQLYKIIGIMEDQLEPLVSDIEGWSSERDLIMRFLYVRQFCICRVRDELGMPYEEQFLSYSIHMDGVLDDYEKENPGRVDY